MIKKSIDCLTGFRAIAAYSVLLAHSISIAFSYSGTMPLRGFDHALAVFGMSLFFVLSGFVITYNYADSFRTQPWRKAAWAFAAARFARLYPLYIIIFFISLGYLPSPIFEGRHEQLVMFLTLTQSWFNREMMTFPPAWSISTEWFFYLAFALFFLAWRPKLRSPRAILLQAVATCLLLLALLSLAYACRDALTEHVLLALLSKTPTVQHWNWFNYFSPYVRIAEFIMGACAARYYLATRDLPVEETHKRRTQALCSLSLACLAVIVGLNAFWLLQGYFFFLGESFAYAPFIAIILYTSARYGNWLSRLCSRPLMLAAGEISYSVYMFQFWVYTMLTNAYASPAPSGLAYANSFIKLGLCVFLTTVVAYGSYRIIEVPCRRWLRARLTPRPRNEVPAGQLQIA